MNEWKAISNFVHKPLRVHSKWEHIERKREQQLIVNDKQEIKAERV